MHRLHAALLVILAFAVSGCGPAGSQTARSAPQSYWFELLNGRLEPLVGGRPPVRRELRPWTLQERVAALTLFRGTLHAAVQGYGVARLAPGPEPTFDYLYDQRVFAGRTFGGLLPAADYLVCHAYTDAVFDHGIAGAAEVNLIKLYPGAQGHRVDYLDSAGRGAGWELVRLLSEGGGAYAAEWKLATEQESRFRYSRIQLATLKDMPISRDEFRAAYRTTVIEEPGRAAGSVAGQLVNRIGRDLPEDVPAIFSFRDGARREQYLLRPEATGNPIQITIARGPYGVVALHPDGRLYMIRSGVARVQRHDLPRLPDGYRYHDVQPLEGWVVAAWEQVDFYNVGRSGVLMLRRPIQSSAGRSALTRVIQVSVG